MERAAGVLVEVTRGPVTESLHRGHLALVDGRGTLLASVGDPEQLLYARSAAKPIQALPLLTSGAADRFALDAYELALVCGSHAGEPMHTRAVADLLDRLGLAEDALRCGVHEPYDPWVRAALQAQGTPPSPLHNNCSGKHAGMLALALHLGVPAEGYPDPGHPVQVRILDHLARLSGRAPGAYTLATDGCGVPTFAMPLAELARLFARLAAPAELDEELRDASTRVVQAMTAHPDMVAGTARGLSLDTALMRAGRGRVVAKLGAEGLLAAGVRPDPERFPAGLGIALKVEDGDGALRARGPAAVALFQRLGLLEAGAPALAPYAGGAVRSRRNERVGEIRAAFELAWTEAAASLHDAGRHSVDASRKRTEGGEVDD